MRRWSCCRDRILCRFVKSCISRESIGLTGRSVELIGNTENKLTGRKGK